MTDLNTGREVGVQGRGGVFSKSWGFESVGFKSARIDVRSITILVAESREYIRAYGKLASCQSDCSLVPASTSC